MALGEVLAGMRCGWNVLDERNGALDGGGRADILVLDESGWPVVIEAERENYASAERDAIARLGARPVGREHAIATVIALVYPPEFQRLSGAELRDAIRRTDALEYALYTHIREDERGRERLPEAGWLRGGVIELAMLVHRAATPTQRIDALASVLENGVNTAADVFSTLHPQFGVGHGAQLAGTLKQTDDENGQTRRMAMTVLLNALVFHEALAQAGFEVNVTGRRRVVQTIDTFFRLQLERPELLVEWDAILEQNYWPIFGIARRLLDPTLMPIETVSDVLQPLWFTARRLVQGGVTRSHDLTGTVFQRLIADRKFLATYYTRPEAAALLAALALPIDRPPGGADWSDGETLAGVQIGDFACGTGTLLSAAYQRLSLLHELHGGDAKALHGPMMEHGLVGLDVLNIAVHLTAAMLAGSQPDTPFDGECLLTMPYGAQDAGNVAIGSLHLLGAHVQASLIDQAAAITAGGRKPEDVRDLVNRVSHDKFDLVIMNPPFTRPGGQEGTKKGRGNPAFAAFGTPKDVQKQMTAELRAAREGAPLAGGNAGMAADFLDLAIRKNNSTGTLALVLPLSAISGIDWGDARSAVREVYRNVIVITISDTGSHASSFSADTGMAEALIVADRDGNRERGRAVFAILPEFPRSAARSGLVADAILRAMREPVRRLEDGPTGATPLTLGNEYAGQLLDCPLPEDGPWPVVGISDATLAQTAYSIENGLLAAPGLPPNEAQPIPITRIGDIAARGPYHMDVYWDKDNGVPQGPFELIKPATSPVPTYSMLWAHNAERERRLVVEPDSEGQIKIVTERHQAAIEQRVKQRLQRAGVNDDDEIQRTIDEQIAAARETLLTDAYQVWQTATRAHYNRDLRFNSQSLIVAMTERPCIGGRSWPSVIFANPDHEYAFALWSNSTLGLLLHWWTANKTQSGRGSTTVTGIPRIPTLDVRALSDEQHARARAAFEALRGERFLPFDQIDEDEARAELDRALLVDVLGLPESLCADGGPLETLRRKLAAEPQIHGGKRTRVVFTDTGERTERRADR